MHSSTTNAPEGFHNFSWMDATHTKAVLCPDSLLREPVKRRHHNREERRENIDRIRKFIQQFRLENLTPDTAATMINNALRGTFVRSSKMVTSYLDGTQHLPAEIQSYNDRVHKEFEALFIASGLNPSEVMVYAERPLPISDDVSNEELQAYNDEALTTCKNYLKYQFIRSRSAKEPTPRNSPRASRSNSLLPQ